MKKQLILGLTAGLAAMTAAAVLGNSKNLVSLDKAKAETTIANMTMDGTHNVLQVSDLVAPTNGDDANVNVTSSTGGYVMIQSYFRSEGCSNVATGGSNGVVSFDRICSSGWRPSMRFTAKGITSFSITFASNTYIAIDAYRGAGFTTICKRTDAAQKTFTYDFTNDTRFEYGSLTSIQIWFYITSQNTEDTLPVKVESISCSYDVDVCLG